MLITCNNIHDFVSESLVVKCDIIANGMLRMQTPFLYPDEDNIDLFLDQRDKILLTDLGHTISYLLNVFIDFKALCEKGEAIEQICSRFKVKRIGGEFIIDSTYDDLSNSISELILVCQQIADLSKV